MTQVKFYRVETLPEVGEVGSLYFVYKGASPKFYVCTTNGFEQYSDLFSRNFSTLQVDAIANAGDGVVYFTPDTCEIIKDGIKYGGTHSEDYATKQWVEEQNYLTEHQDISGKVDVADFEEATKVTSAALNLFHSNTLWQTEDTYVKCDKSKTEEEALSGQSDIVYFTTDSHKIVLNGSIYSMSDVVEYATKTWVQEQNYLTQHQDISHKVNTEDYNNKILELETIISALGLWRNQEDLIAYDKTKTEEEALVGDPGVIYFTVDTNRIILNGLLYGFSANVDQDIKTWVLQQLIPIWQQLEWDTETLPEGMPIEDLLSVELDALQTENKTVIGAINELNSSVKKYPIRLIEGTNASINPGEYNICTAGLVPEVINFQNISGTHADEYIIRFSVTGTSTPSISFEYNIAWANNDVPTWTSGWEYEVCIVIANGIGLASYNKFPIV